MIYRPAVVRIIYSMFTFWSLTEVRVHVNDVRYRTAMTMTPATGCCCCCRLDKRVAPLEYSLSLSPI